MGALCPTVLPIENLKGNCVPAVSESQLYPGQDLNPGHSGFEHSTLTTRLHQLSKLAKV